MLGPSIISGNNKAMKNIISVTLYIFTAIHAQDFKMADDDGLPKKPEKCFGTDEILDRRCCIFPPFFTREVARMCGARFALMEINKNANVTSLRREAPVGCEYWTCVLKAYGLLTENKNLDVEKLFSHLDVWVELNPTFEAVVLNAKVRCKQMYRFFMPLSTCEYFDMHTCLRTYINVNCPKMIQDDGCRLQKEFYDECRQYFI